MPRLVALNKSIGCHQSTGFGKQIYPRCSSVNSWAAELQVQVDRPYQWVDMACLLEPDADETA